MSPEGRAPSARWRSTPQNDALGFSRRVRGGVSGGGVGFGGIGSGGGPGVGGGIGSKVSAIVLLDEIERLFVK